MTLKVAPYWGKLVDMNGDYIRKASEKEWRDAQDFQSRLGTMGYIVIDTISPMGVPHKMYACVVGGYDIDSIEQPTVKG
jgi:hypothetical protein